MQPKPPSNPGRRKFLVTATSIVGVGAVVGTAIPFVKALNPSEQAKASGAPAIADISKLSKGEMMIVEWRGIPIYIIRHTDESLKVLNNNLSRLSDPESKEDQEIDKKVDEYKKNLSAILLAPFNYNSWTKY